MMLASKEELIRSLKNPDFTMLGDAILRASARNLEERRNVKNDSPPRKTASDDVDFNAAGDNVNAATETNDVEPKVPSRLKPTSDPIIVLSARADFLQTFRDRAKGFVVKTAVLRPSRKEAVERFLRANPESPVFVYVSGRQVAEFVSDLDDSLTSKMILVNIETKAAITRPERFRDIFEVYYRHPELGKVVAESYLELRTNQTAAIPRRTAASQSTEQ
jgi:hypothetical protein